MDTNRTMREQFIAGLSPFAGEPEVEVRHREDGCCVIGETEQTGAGEENDMKPASKAVLAEWLEEAERERAADNLERAERVSKRTGHKFGCECRRCGDALMDDVDNFLGRREEANERAIAAQEADDELQPTQGGEEA